MAGCPNYEVKFVDDVEYETDDWGEVINTIPTMRPIGDYCSKYEIYNPRCDKCEKARI